ncbi:MAG: glycosyltransferase family 2 protein [Gemmataceae bacterium]|nr:glycosyltransferase family 2 protein [Gemmataceae bacterium]
MSSDRVTLSIVCPAYNEEEVLPLFHAELSTVLATLEDTYRIEIVYVDDGSRDRTLQVLRAMADADPRVRYLSFSRNFGHQAALSAGLEASRGDVVVTMDSDLQHPPSLIPRLLTEWQQGNDIVLTVREDEASTGTLKRLSSQCFYRAMALLSNTEIRPAAADFRLMSRRAVDSLLQMRETHRFLRGMVQWLGFPKSEVHFTIGRRGAGHSKYNLRRMLAFAADGMISFSKTPLRLMMLLGVVAATFGMTDSVFLLLRGLCRGELEVTLGLLLGSVYLIGGGLLFAVGVVGEYVGRIYEQVKARPLYIVKEASRAEDRSGRKPGFDTTPSALHSRAA